MRHFNFFFAKLFWHLVLFALALFASCLGWLFLGYWFGFAVCSLAVLFLIFWYRRIH